MQSLGDIFKYKLLFFIIFIPSILTKNIYPEINTYQKLEELYLNSFKLELQEQDYLAAYNKETDSIDNNKMHEIIYQKFTLPRNNTQVILNLFKSDKTESPKNLVKTSTKLYENLEIFCGQNISSSHLLSKIDRTQSYAGRITLSKILLEPTFDIQELQNRQEIIKALLENKNIDILEKIIKEYKDQEEILLKFFDKKEFNNMFGSENYFPGAFWALDALIDVLPEELIDALGVSELAKTINSNSGKLNLINLFNIIVDTKNTYSLITKYIPRDYKDLKTNYGDFKRNLYNSKNNAQNLNFLAASSNLGKTLLSSWDILSSVGDLFANTMHIRNNIKTNIKKHNQVKKIHKKLSQISKIITSTDKIKTFIIFNKSLSNKFGAFKELDEYFKDITKQDYLFNKLLNSLRSKIYSKEDASFIELYFLRGKILQTAYLLASTQQYLVKFIKAIGQVDAYLSIAKLYKENKNNNAKYCFANYLEQENSYIYLENFWTPFLNPQTAILNSIELGALNSPKCALITGPNAGGKSTILKAILINSLLAQTITIAPANTCILTPFYYLDSYLNITDDISNGNSLFKAEVLRVKDLLFNIENNNKSLVIVDEMFSGTNPKEGSSASFAIADYIAKLAYKDNKILALLATHYSIMTQLEVKTNNIIKNYHVDAFVNKQDQKIEYPFKLINGPADKTVAIDLLEFENFDKSIIDTAREIVATA
ncbi:MAG: hypothetical protein SZ59_C0001G0127 [candidate division TM6 bacterium GW2011_GWF2_28_16]|nr:MAG: hypothetical protein SZ59_C0001G0127 [candidate division TM6 bacterium GW2011_GWF2_28_16]